MDNYAQFPKTQGSGVTYTIDNQKITMPPAPTATATRRYRKSGVGAHCAYCSAGSTCTACKKVQAMSQYGVRPIVRAHVQEANRVYNTLYTNATTRPTFNYYY